MMNTQALEGLVRTSRTPWTPLLENGVDTAGISVKPLRADSASGRPLSFVLRFDPGAKYPYHSHPAGEELFVLAGSCLIEGTRLEAGDYLYTAPGGKHSVQTEMGCTLLFQVPEEVMIL
jgi:anti-sigma factor ChrR (cupin superfamily)